MFIFSLVLISMLLYLHVTPLVEPVQLVQQFEHRPLDLTRTPGLALVSEYSTVWCGAAVSGISSKLL